MYVPTDDQFFSKVDKTKPDIAFLKNHFYREGRLTEEQALYILEKLVYVPLSAGPEHSGSWGRNLRAAQRWRAFEIRTKLAGS